MTEPEAEMGELLETVEEIRARDFPGLDPKLVSDILGVQRQLEDRAEARQRTQQIINRWTADRLGSGEA